MPSQNPINESHHAQRASPFRNQHPFCNPPCRPTHVVLLQKRLNCWGSCTPLALCLAPRRMRAAFLNCWGSCTPLAYFFLLLKKSRSPHAVGTGVSQRIEGNKRCFRAKRFRKASHVGADGCGSKSTGIGGWMGMGFTCVRDPRLGSSAATVAIRADQKNASPTKSGDSSIRR